MEKAINDEMSEKELSYETVRLLEIELQRKRRAWLRKYGWEYSCDFIDDGWRWLKTIDGKLMMCDEAEAINLEYNYLSEN